MPAKRQNKRHNPKRAKAILREVFTRRNPADTTIPAVEAAHQKVAVLAAALGDENTNISSIPEGDVISALEDDGLDADEIYDVMEDLAAWGVTDEV